jgi:integrase
VRRQVSRGGYATRALALAAMAELQVTSAAGTYIERSRQTVGEYLTAWVAGVAGSGQVRASTYTSYETSIRAHIVPRLGEIPLQQLTRNEVRALYDQLRAHGRVKGAVGGLSAKTVHNIHLCLHRALSDALDDGLLKSNPADRAHRLPPDRPEMRTWSRDQLQAFLAAVEDTPMRALWRLAASTGMRRGEVLGLRWEDVDLDGGRLSVRQQLVRDRQTVAFGPPKTKAGRRSITLDPGTIAALYAHSHAQTANRLYWGAGYQPHNLVFARPDGSPHDPDSISQQFLSLSSRARLPRIKLHELRHTHATLLLAAGTHPKVVQERLGHSSIVVTLDRYSHVIPNLQDEAAVKIGAILG